MTKNYLLITLGHNSSAVFFDASGDYPEVIGYEQERLSRIKVDSQFPIDAINEIIYNVGFDKLKNCAIRISHWFNFLAKNVTSNKYMTSKNYEFLKSLSYDIEMVNPDFTHHDAHAYSAYAFYKYYANIDSANHAPVYCIVADGFGNDEEVLSIYSYDIKNNKSEPQLVHRAYGYYSSLGLMYQYATSFVGMKENQDEYKFLGYEAHIEEEFTSEEIGEINSNINRYSKHLADMLMTRTSKENIDCKDLIDYHRLKDVKAHWHYVFKQLLVELGIEDFTSFKARVAIAFFIQQTIEKVVCYLVREFGMKNVCVAGGCFYNVKLNNAVLNEVKAFNGNFCAMPLAGDQGAAIGFIEAETNKQFPFRVLTWGKRRLYNFDKIAANSNGSIFYFEINREREGVERIELISKLIAKYIADGKITNVIFGDMEFGPRALGATSTLFLPTVDNTADNNHMNKRNEVMPCAPICTRENAAELFTDSLKNVVGSDHFMICTHEYVKAYSKQYGGVMHKIPFTDSDFSGRPQIVRKNTFMYHVLKAVEELTDIKCLVNTSFNAHGNPIVFDTADIMQNFNFQREHACEGKEPVMFVIKFTDGNDK